MSPLGLNRRAHDNHVIDQVRPSCSLNATIGRTAVFSLDSLLMHLLADVEIAGGLVAGLCDSCHDLMMKFLGPHRIDVPDIGAGGVQVA